MAYRENEGPYDTLTPDNSVVLLIDHQVGLMNIIRDMSAEEVKNNVLGLAKTARTLGIPVVLTTSIQWGPNGMLIPELQALFPDVQVIPRPGVINAYRWPAFREAVEATGRKKAIIAAVTDTTCLQFPALDMVRDGYDVHGVIDASGAESPMAREAGVATLAMHGVKVRTWFSVAAELIADWRRDEARGWPLAGGAVHEHLPAWGYLLDSATNYGMGRMVKPDGRAEATTRTAMGSRRSYRGTHHHERLGGPQGRGGPAVLPCLPWARRRVPADLLVAAASIPLRWGHCLLRAAA